MDQGQAPAALLKCHCLRLMLYLYPAQFHLTWEGRKCRSRGLEQVVVRDLLSQNEMWCFISDAAGVWWVAS